MIVVDRHTYRSYRRDRCIVVGCYWPRYLHRPV